MSDSDNLGSESVQPPTKKAKSNYDTLLSHHMSLTPWFRSPLTDITANLVTHQWFGSCAKMELKVIECLEAYGLDRGKLKCDDLLADFRECSNRDKQMRRAYAMRIERNRQYYAGERKKEDLYAPPPKFDSF